MVVKSLSTLCKWKNLRKLTIEGAPIHDGRFLVDIAKSCRLKSLNLRYLGARAKCNYIEDLCTALRHLQGLQDFRLEQNYIGSTVRLLTSLKQCKSLRRFLLWSNSNDQALDQQSCLSLMEACLELQMLYITIGATTKIMCETIRKNIESKYKRSRPGLHVVIRRGTTTDIEDEILPTIYPSVHYRNMVVFAPQICQQNDFNVL
ncbi:unnamed protein product [Allacma fusca]|uniref:F-box/LRR-repeat protein 18 LRR domain-containing protein n=1 Tax=Allacma fusca TaxID=39272 RepID=A0A8J2KB45_9HEXA|nr:unnamed protein product [Allacma fusca]